MKFKQFPPDARPEFFKEFLIFKRKLQRVPPSPSYRLTLPKKGVKAADFTDGDKIDVILHKPEFNSPIVSNGLNIRNDDGSFRVTVRKSDLPFDDIESSVWQFVARDPTSKGWINIENLSKVIGNLWNYAIFKDIITNFDGTDYQKQVTSIVPLNEAQAIGLEDKNPLNVRAVNLSQDNVGPLRDQATRRVTIFDTNRKKQDMGPSLAFVFPELAVRANGWSKGDIIQYVCR